MTEQFLESLEQRIAPATLVDAKTVQFHDAEGDLIQVSISKGAFTESDFTFTTGNFGDTGPQTLASLNLDSIFAGANITISVLTAGTGEGSNKAQIGGIEAAGVKLGSVSIAGDLGFIDAGDSKSGIKSLTVDSLGMLTPADFGQTDRTSDVAGAIAALTINGDFGGTLNVTGGKKGSIGKAYIGGDLVSGAGDIAGYIHATGAIKTIYVGGSIDGSNANAANEAGIVSDLSIKTVTVVGSVEGGGFKNTGVIIAGLPSAEKGELLKGTTKITSISIGEDVIGGAGKYSGAIIGWAGLGTVAVGGNLTGGTGEDSGTIQAGGLTTIPNPNTATGQPATIDIIVGANISKVTIGQDVTGDDGVRSASILSWGTSNAKGKAIGGVFGEVNVGGSVTGGDGTFSALVYGYAGIKNATVGVDLVGGAGDDSGRIATDRGSLGTISIGHDVKGGAGVESGTIFAGGGSISSVFVGHDLIGGGDTDAGTIWADANVGTVTITGNVQGGTSARTGSIIIFGSAKSIFVGESVTGTNYSFTGYVQAQKGVTEIFIGKDLVGGDSIAAGGTTFSGAIAVGGVDTGVIWGSVKKLTIGRDIVSGQVETGTLQNSGAIRVNGYIGDLIVGGSVRGNEEMAVWITGLVNPTQSVMSNLAIKSVDITGNVEHALIVAGVISASNPFYPAAPFARIGDVEVGGDWTASSIAAGVEPGEDGYGDGDIPLENFFTSVPKYGLSKINSINIHGNVEGGAEGDQYGFAAQSFGKITIGGVVQQIPVVGSTTNVTQDGSVKIHTVEKERPPETAA